MSKPTLNVCLKNERKRIYINRTTIEILGNPTHLCFLYDGKENLLFVSPTSAEDLNGYEIPKFFWNSRQSCEMSRIAFFIALKYRLNWEEDAKYSFTGAQIDYGGFPAVVFNMTEGRKVG